MTLPIGGLSTFILVTVPHPPTVVVRIRWMVYVEYLEEELGTQAAGAPRREILAS